jgi:phenylpyruvate tautomerase PptA (4-oxalocrotonate tautomerase family)
MPLVRISVMKGRSAAQKRALGDAVHRALVETIDVPALDRFQVITEHEPGDLVYDPEYLGIHRSDGVVFIQITLSRGRSLAQKRALYRGIAANLHESTGLRTEDVFVSLVEVGREDWSFGHGFASYAPEMAETESVPI